MQTQKAVALLAAGRISTSFLTRMPQLTERIGPLASTSLRLASRFSNLLNAGHPVSSMAPIGRCSTILISAASPGFFVNRILEERSITWKGKIVVLCDSTEGSESLAPLKNAGAAVASLMPVEGTDNKLFVAEGCPGALRQLRTMLEPLDARLLRINPGDKTLYLAGVNFATGMLLPVVAAATEALRASGLGPHQAVEVAERLVARTLRSYRKAGRNGWEGALPRGDIESIRGQYQALAANDTTLAAFYLDLASLLLKVFKHGSAFHLSEEAAALTANKTRAARA